MCSKNDDFSHLKRTPIQAVEKCETLMGKEQSEDPSGELFAREEVEAFPTAKKTL